MIIIKSKEEIGLMREGGKLLARIMDELGQIIVPGENTFAINKLARKLVFDIGGIAVFEGYGGPDNPYPAAVCISINNEIVHGIPREDRIIAEGDIVKLDIGMRYKGMVTDMARTFPAGEINKKARRIMETTKGCLDEGIRKIKAGEPLCNYGRTVEYFAKRSGYSVVRDLVGHGVGRELHEDPQILNYDGRGNEMILREGMTLALEPMINEGRPEIGILEDGWTYVTRDGKLSAHFEDTVLVTKQGAEILTRI